MNVTLSIDERLVKEARRVALAMGKSLNQLIRDYLQTLTAEQDVEEQLTEFRRLSADNGGRSAGWRFNRDEIHERS